MTNYRLYIEERENLELYEDHKGFFTYKKVASGLQINDLFVLPAFRKRGIGKEYSEIIIDIAKEYDCKTIYCFSSKDANNWQRSHDYIISNGYTEIIQKDMLVYYKKEL